MRFGTPLPLIDFDSTDWAPSELHRISTRLVSNASGSSRSKSTGRRSIQICLVAEQLLLANEIDTAVEATVVSYTGR
jgi:hypothetical protein